MGTVQDRANLALLREMVVRRRSGFVEVAVQPKARRAEYQAYDQSRVQRGV